MQSKNVVRCGAAMMSLEQGECFERRKETEELLRLLVGNQGERIWMWFGMEPVDRQVVVACTLLLCCRGNVCGTAGMMELVACEPLHSLAH